MKRIKLLLILLPLASLFMMLTPKAAVSVAAWSGEQTSTAGDYYEAVRGKSGQSLKDGLNQIITRNVDQEYDWARYEAADEMEGQTSKVMGIYSREAYNKTAHVSGSTGWNREHSYPQSMLTSSGLSGSTGSGNTAFNDNHHIFASDNKVNGARGNLKLGVVASHSSPIVDSYGNVTDNYKTTSIFEPTDAAKGEVARATLYMVTMYPVLAINTNFQTEQLCFDWHETFEVTNREVYRNNTVHNLQGNRNPFIDHPEFATMIWDESYSGAGALDDTSLGGGGTTPVEPVSLTINGQTSVAVGQQLQLTASVLPSNASQAATWTSYNPSVATVSSSTGLVTGVSVGSTTIMAWSNRNQNIYDEIIIEVVTEGDLPPVSGTITFAGAGKAAGLTTSAAIMGITTDTGNHLNSYSAITRIYDGGASGSNGGYPAAISNALRFGSGSGTGTIALDFDTQISSITLTTSAWSNGAYTPSVNSINGSSLNTNTLSTSTFSNINSSTVVITGTARFYLYAIDYGFEAATTPVSSVSLSATSATIPLDSTYQLQWTVLPSDATNKAVVFASNDQNVATVSATGLITATGVGATDVTIQTVDGNYTDTIRITVNPISVTGLNLLSKVNVSLNVGATANINYEVLPSNATNKTVSFETSNNPVASVSSTGVISAKQAGNAIITLRTVDGNYTKTVNVTVSTIAVAGITITSSNALTLDIGGTSLITHQISPSNAANQNVVYSSSNPLVATVNNGLVTALSSGTSTITVTTVEGAFTGTVLVTVRTPGTTNPEYEVTDAYHVTLASNNLGTTNNGSVVNQVKTLNSLDWNFNAEIAMGGDSLLDQIYFGYDGTKGLQIGSSNDPAASINLRTVDLYINPANSATKVTSVKVNASLASGTSATLVVRVGGVILDQVSLATSAKEYLFPVSERHFGHVEVEIIQGSTPKAMYLKSITIENEYHLDSSLAHHVANLINHHDTCTLVAHQVVSAAYNGLSSSQQAMLVDFFVDDLTLGESSLTAFDKYHALNDRFSSSTIADHTASINPTSPLMLIILLGISLVFVNVVIIKSRSKKELS